MREVTVDLGGTSYTLAADFKAAWDVAETVADPLMMARELTSRAPKWQFTVRNIPQILWIGARRAGDKRSLEDWQRIVFDAGFVAGKDAALEYLVAIVGPGPKEPPEPVEDADAGN